MMSRVKHKGRSAMEGEREETGTNLSLRLEPKNPMEGGTSRRPRIEQDVLLGSHGKTRRFRLIGSMATFFERANFGGSRAIRNR